MGRLCDGARWGLAVRTGACRVAGRGFHRSHKKTKACLPFVGAPGGAMARDVGWPRKPGLAALPDRAFRRSYSEPGSLPTLCRSAGRRDGARWGLAAKTGACRVAGRAFRRSYSEPGSLPTLCRSAGRRDGARWWAGREDRVLPRCRIAPSGAPTVNPEACLPFVGAPEGAMARDGGWPRRPGLAALPFAPSGAPTVNPEAYLPFVGAPGGAMARGGGWPRRPGLAALPDRAFRRSYRAPGRLAVRRGTTARDAATGSRRAGWR